MLEIATTSTLISPITISIFLGEGVALIFLPQGNIVLEQPGRIWQDK
jgi:hypothetical protein